MGRSVSFFNYLRCRVEAKRSTGRFSSVDLYRAAGRHFRAYLGKDCSLAKITSIMVDDFKSYLKGKGLRSNTINSYLSSLRAVYNAACRESLVSPLKHPFAHLRLKREATAKRAVPVQVLERMAEEDWSDSPMLERAVDLSLFSFLAQGMPLVDLMSLRKENIQGNELVYCRRKTGTQIRMLVSSGMRRLMRKYQSDSNFIFPFLKEERNHQDYKSFLTRHNQALRAVGDRIKLNLRISSYVIRHTWASEALRQDIPVALISQAMGHASEKVTRCYLRLLDVSTLGRANRKVIGRIDDLVVRKSL